MARLGVPVGGRVRKLRTVRSTRLFPCDGVKRPMGVDKHKQLQ